MVTLRHPPRPSHPFITTGLANVFAAVGTAAGGLDVESASRVVDPSCTEIAIRWR